MKTEAQETVQGYLRTLHDRAVSTLENGNAFGAAYLACLCGMWSHTLHQNKNLFEDDATDLFVWFRAGYAGSAEATQMNDRLKSVWDRKEKAEDKLRETEKKNKWKLW